MAIKSDCRVIETVSDPSIFTRVPLACNRDTNVDRNLILLINDIVRNGQSKWNGKWIKINFYLFDYTVSFVFEAMRETWSKCGGFRRYSIYADQDLWLQLSNIYNSHKNKQISSFLQKISGFVTALFTSDPVLRHQRSMIQSSNPSPVLIRTISIFYIGKPLKCPPKSWWASVAARTSTNMAGLSQNF